MGIMPAASSRHGTCASRVLHLSAEGASLKLIDLNQLAGPLERCCLRCLSDLQHTQLALLKTTNSAISVHIIHLMLQIC